MPFATSSFYQWRSERQAVMQHFLAVAQLDTIYLRNASICWGDIGFLLQEG